MLDVLGFAHVNLNCRRLDRSRAFYERAFGLRAGIHTRPEPQDCRAFGLPGEGQWDAWLLGDPDGTGGGCAIDLLEWQRPRPSGDPGSRPGQLGLRALAFEVEDLGLACERLRAAGAPARVSSESSDLALAEDPDGVALLLMAGSRRRLRQVELSCADLPRARAFYGELLGLAAAEPEREQRLATGLVRRSQPLVLPAHPEGFRVELARWLEPPPDGAPARAANQVGLFRMAFLVPDLDAAHATLRRRAVPGLTPPVELELGPDCPAPSCRALFFRDPDGSCLELIELPASPPA